MDLKRAVNSIRGFSMDDVQAADSGHSGMPMGMADAAAVLRVQSLKHNPEYNPQWAERDPFMLSAGHDSMRIDSLLHPAGYDLPFEELNYFRQWGSQTAGHPEYGHTIGVEATAVPSGRDTQAPLVWPVLKKYDQPDTTTMFGVLSITMPI